MTAKKNIIIKAPRQVLMSMIHPVLCRDGSSVLLDDALIEVSKGVTIRGNDQQNQAWVRAHFSPKFFESLKGEGQFGIDLGVLEKNLETLFGANEKVSIIFNLKQDIITLKGDRVTRRLIPMSVDSVRHKKMTAFVADDAQKAYKTTTEGEEYPYPANFVTSGQELSQLTKMSALDDKADHYAYEIDAEKNQVTLTIEAAEQGDRSNRTFVRLDTSGAVMGKGKTLFQVGTAFNHVFKAITESVTVIAADDITIPVWFRKVADNHTIDWMIGQYAAPDEEGEEQEEPTEEVKEET